MRKIVITVVIAALLLLAGCEEQQEAQGQELSNDTGIDTSGVEVGNSYAYEIAVTEKNQLGLVKAQPPFVMEESLERANLIRRYQYLNNRNNVHHVYMLSEDGKVVSYMVAQGKVSSVNSKLTNDNQIVYSQSCVNRGGGGSNDGGDDETNCYKTVESPQIDGSYGTNGDAIFFFTTDGQYVEYNGIYLVSEEPKNIQTQVSLVANASAKSTDVFEENSSVGFNTSTGTNVSVSANESNATGNTTDGKT